VKKVFKAADAPIEWDEQYISKTADPRTNSFITRENLDSVLVRPPVLLYTSKTLQVSR
jgi:isocitrate dehydrogenase (NAD+)